MIFPIYANFWLMSVFTCGTQYLALDRDLLTPCANFYHIQDKGYIDSFKHRSENNFD